MKNQSDPLVKKIYIAKVLPFYIPASSTQNMSIWQVARSSIAYSKLNDKILILSPNSPFPISDKALQIKYITNCYKDSSDKTNNIVNEINNWNLNHKVDKHLYSEEVIKLLMIHPPAFIEVEADYRLAGLLAKRFKKIPVWLINHTSFAKRNFWNRAIQYIRYIRHISGLIFVSNANLKLYKKLFFYSRKPFLVIHNSYAHISQAKPLKLSFFQTKHNKIIFAGRATKDKGYQEYLQAVESILQKYPAWQATAVLSVESINHKNQIEAFLSSNPKLSPLIQSKQLSFYYNIPNNQLFELFKEAKILVFPTHPKWVEGLPLTLIEAHLAMCAIIASPQPGSQEASKQHSLYLNSGQNIDPTDIINKLVCLIDNEEFMSNMALLGHNMALKNYDITSLVKKYDQLRQRYL